MTAAQRKAPRARKKSRGGLFGLGIAPWVAFVPVLVAGVAAVVAVVVLSVGSSSGTSGTPTPYPEDDRVRGLPVGQTLALEAGGDADKAFYNPTTLTGKAGEVIEITVTNTGTVIHNLRVSGPNKIFDVDTTGEKGDDFEMPPNTVEPGKTGSLKIKIDTPGTYPFRCDFHPLIQKGTLILQ
ncbi:MAG: cupredoxin domain-containing protein [Chloroflexi bacterium]|nr:cupredoxin domain-containing protein [Chloroflexota bacterium]